MQLVDHDTFLKKLTDLFESTKDHGSIWLTHKRLTHDGQDAAMKHEDEAGKVDSNEYTCLVRVTDGKKNRFSTKVEPSELLKFQTYYGALLKQSMTTLRKRDKKREKSHAEEAAKRKKKMTEPVKLESGPNTKSGKRGPGRRQRQRKIHALLKQQESQKKFEEREKEAAKRKEEY
ncbi:hypothetical protein CVT24_006877 [Panaeolus cyanescens]|uniref:Signal recognition particle subunit SRP14 n=1 Tax=Panaeolus cyanescens TaxID=181874 RepID=A0A409YWZ3_9AGAR|nr:hypothetical protein CVT24_006877 [Panaeolus cyanescens]